MSEDDPTDGASFAFVAGASGSLNLDGWWVAFDRDESTPAEKRERFHRAIDGLKGALDAYEPLANVFELDDDRLIAASTAVHLALRNVQAEHSRVTGGNFPRPRGALSVRGRDHNRDIEPEPEPDDLELIPPREFSVVVPLDLELLIAGGRHRVREALAYSNGVLLTIESFLDRGDSTWRSWRERYETFLSFDTAGVTLIVDGDVAAPHGGSASGGTRTAERDQQFWVHGPFNGDVLECEYRIAGAEPVRFALDARVLREAQRRARPV